MSTDRDVTRIVRSWLHEDAHEDADRILDLVLQEIDTTPQRSASWLTRRFPIMNSNTFRVAVAAAAVIVLVFIGIRFLLPGSTTPGVPPVATPTPTLEPSPTPVPLLNGDVSQPPGRYRVDATNLPMQVTVDVPDGWTASGNWVVMGPKGNQAPDGMAIRFYVAPRIYSNPLAPGDGLVLAVGPTVDDLVNAIVNHPDWPTTGHAAITIDGYAGQVVHLTLPAGTSDATPFYLFTDDTGGQVWGWAAGQLFDVYVIDVGGKRLQIDAFHYPNTTAADLAAQAAVIDTIQLAP